MESIIYLRSLLFLLYMQKKNIARDFFCNWKVNIVMSSHDLFLKQL